MKQTVTKYFAKQMRSRVQFAEPAWDFADMIYRRSLQRAISQPGVQSMQVTLFHSAVFMCICVYICMCICVYICICICLCNFV